MRTRSQYSMAFEQCDKHSVFRSCFWPTISFMGLCWRLLMLIFVSEYHHRFIDHRVPSFQRLLRHIQIASVAHPSLLSGLRRKRRFWCAPREGGLWPEEILERPRSGQELAWLGRQSVYVSAFRMANTVFWSFTHRYIRTSSNAETGYVLQSSCSICQTVCCGNLLANSLVVFQLLRSLFGIGKSTAISIVHKRVTVWRKHTVPRSLVLDGTVMEIKKPTVYEGVCVCKCWPSWISKWFLYLQVQ
jgi:hypothetical protein